MGYLKNITIIPTLIILAIILTSPRLLLAATEYSQLYFDSNFGGTGYQGLVYQPASTSTKNYDNAVFTVATPVDKVAFPEPAGGCSSLNGLLFVSKGGDGNYVTTAGGTVGSHCEYYLYGSGWALPTGYEFNALSFGGVTYNLKGSKANAGNTWDSQHGDVLYSPGGFAFQLCSSYTCDQTFTPPSNYYAQIKNTSGGSMNFRSGSSTSAAIIKTLPEDWIVYVGTTTDQNGAKMTADGYNWYQITDPTDNVQGWMAGENASGTVTYLPYDFNQQSSFQATSSNYIATSSRPALILDIINHYYNDTSTSSSLYSSNDGTNNISILKERDFEEKVLWGMMAQESGIIDFNNEYVSFDYGHGIGQITFNAWTYEPSYPHSTYDNRGEGSNVKIIPCASVGTGDYTNCYTGAGTGNMYPKPYQHYAGNSNNPVYKQYTNTEQSMYANIKDGLKVLQYKYNNFYPISTSTTVNGTTYTATEREIILATAGYNGACGYVDDVADKLDNIDAYFPTATSSDISTLIQKMHIAGSSAICAQLYSPGELSIEDSVKRTAGVVNGKVQNDIPLAIIDKGQKIVKILSPDAESYTYKVIGTDKGSYGLDITIKDGGGQHTFKATGIAMLPGQIHTYSVDKEALLKGQEGVIVKIDRDGDGTPERILNSGTVLTSEVYNTEATPEELEAVKIKEVIPRHRIKTKPEGSAFNRYLPHREPGPEMITDQEKRIIEQRALLLNELKQNE